MNKKINMEVLNEEMLCNALDNIANYMATYEAYRLTVKLMLNAHNKEIRQLKKELSRLKRENAELQDLVHGYRGLYK